MKILLLCFDFGGDLIYNHKTPKGFGSNIDRRKN
jgi:hypothetical protein